MSEAVADVTNAAQDAITVLSSHTRESILYCGASDGRIKAWDMSLCTTGLGPVYAMTHASPDIFLVGGDHGIQIWSTSSEHRKIASLPGFLSDKRLADFETNDLAWNAQRKELYSACGDSNAYAWDIETQKAKRQFTGHSSVVYCVQQLSTNRFCTASEDGFVRIWDPREAKALFKLCSTRGTAEDLRTGKVSHTLPDTENKEEKSSKVARTPWIGCLAADPAGDWLVCGGGGRFLALWHIPSGTVTATMPTAGTPQAVTFQDGYIFSAGNEGAVYQWNRSGQLLGKPSHTTSKSLFTVNSVKVSNRHVFVAAGNSKYVDVFIEPNIHSFALQF